MPGAPSTHVAMCTVCAPPDPLPAPTPIPARTTSRALSTAPPPRHHLPHQQQQHDEAAAADAPDSRRDKPRKPQPVTFSNVPGSAIATASPDVRAPSPTGDTSTNRAAAGTASSVLSAPVARKHVTSDGVHGGSSAAVMASPGRVQPLARASRADALSAFQSNGLVVGVVSSTSGGAGSLRPPPLVVPRHTLPTGPHAPPDGKWLTELLLPCHSHDLCRCSVEMLPLHPHIESN